ncbi:uncharacterized protein G2W53_042350 [Senna tora]|uniref:Uncharacterized protein n=1 Tax=Senna tora TaxID=362788 RepID=A0A834W3R6_9FABA|nr:uncharacterized protein G2W53_042350 [Senna tora]
MALILREEGFEKRSGIVIMGPNVLSLEL